MVFVLATMLHSHSNLLKVILEEDNVCFILDFVLSIIDAEGNSRFLEHLYIVVTATDGTDMSFIELECRTEAIWLFFADQPRILCHEVVDNQGSLIIVSAANN